MNEPSGKALELAYLLFEIEKNRIQMEQLMEKAKKLTTAIESNGKAQKKQISENCFVLDLR